jgi:hypothetical protein
MPRRPFSGVFWIAWLSMTEPTEESSVWIAGGAAVTSTVSCAAPTLSEALIWAV